MPSSARAKAAITKTTNTSGSWRLFSSVRIVGNAPNGAVAVFRDQEGSIMGHGYAHRPAPNALIIDDKARHEVIVFTRRDAVVQSHANDFVTGARGAIPRAVQSNEGIATIFSRKCRNAFGRGV